jgi:hypothetical protein
MHHGHLVVEFPNLTRADGNKSAESLRQALLDAAPDEVQSAELLRTDDAGMDMGATLAIVLGTPAAIAFARGLAAWVRKHGTEVIIKEDGEVLIRNIESKDAAEIVRALNRGSEP